MNTAPALRPRPRAASPVATGTLVAMWAALSAAPASAFDIDTGQPDLKLRWDNTVKYSAGVRVNSRDGTLAPAAGAPASAIVAAINQDDGDRNFARGDLISNRLNLYSEADLAYRGYGLRVSAAAWYDTVYNRSNANDSAGLFGPGSSTSNSPRGIDEFTDGTRHLHGRKAELLDAFAYGKFDLAETSTTLRLGQHALVWGESLFLGSNAIAGAQNATDIVKALSVPNSQVKEIVLPVPQISMQSILTPAISIGAYYQFHYVPNRLPGAGSYFSNTEITPEGIGYAYVGPNRKVPITTLSTKNTGQGGVQLRMTLGDTDVGLYAIRYHDKGVQPFPILGANPGGAPAPTSFVLARQEGIRAFGASFSHTFGDVNLAGEASTRRGTVLSAVRIADTSALLPPGAPRPVYNNSDNPVYPIGNTAHANVSTIWSVPSTGLWREAAFLGELAWNRLLSCEKNCAALPTAGTRDAWQLAAVFTPTYNQALPGLNLSVPIGLTYTPKGSRSLALGPGPSGPENGGSINIGLSGLYQDAWRIGLTYMHYYGRADLGIQADFTYQQTLKDRDYVSVSLSRTF